VTFVHKFHLYNVIRFNKYLTSETEIVKTKHFDKYNSKSWTNFDSNLRDSLYFVAEEAAVAAAVTTVAGSQGVS